MKTNPRMHRGFTLVELLVVIVIIAALAGLTAPMVIGQRKKADRTEATNNAKNIGLALFNFQSEQGGYPDKSTSDQLTKDLGTPPFDVTDTTTANGLFRQLLAAGVTDSESMFWCKTGYTLPKKADGVTANNKAIEKGECGFAYILNGDDTGLSTAGNSGRPIIAAPLMPTVTAGEFDKDYYESKAVVGKLDQSVVLLTIDSNKKAILGGGKDLLTVGTDTVWDQPTTGNPKMVLPIKK